MLADITRDAEGSEALALDTGGFVVKNSNDLAGGITRVSSESRIYYLLGYNPTDLTPRRQVPQDRGEAASRARAKGLEVRARRGYYAPARGRPGEATSGEDDARAAGDRARPRLALRHPRRPAAGERLRVRRGRPQPAQRPARRRRSTCRDVAFKEEEGRFKDALAFVIEAQHRETGEYYRYDQTIEMSLLPETRRSCSAQPGTRSRASSRCRPAATRRRSSCATWRSGKIGSVVHEFEVPAGGTVPAVDADAQRRGRRPRRRRRAEAGAAGPPRVRVGLDRCTASTASSARSARRQGSLMPRVVSSATRSGAADGAGVPALEPRRRSSPQRGLPAAAVGIPLAGAAPGEYEIVLTVKDELSGQAVEVREPFAISGRADRGPRAQFAAAARP